MSSGREGAIHKVWPCLPEPLRFVQSDAQPHTARILTHYTWGVHYSNLMCRPDVRGKKGLTEAALRLNAYAARYS